MTIDKNIIVDLTRVQPHRVIKIHEGDVNSVFLVLTVTNLGTSVSLTGLTIKYDATINNYLAEQDASGTVDTTNNTIRIPVTSNMTAMSGTLRVDVRMIYNTEVLYTQTITMLVEKSVVEGSTYIDFSRTSIVQRMKSIEEDVAKKGNAFVMPYATAAGYDFEIPTTYEGELGDRVTMDEYSGSDTTGGSMWELYKITERDGTTYYHWRKTVDTDDLEAAISEKEDTSNKVTNLSANSTNTQYPSAKCVYDLTGTEMSGALVAAGLRLQSATDQQGTFFFITARPQNQMLVRGVMENATISDVHTNLLANVASQYGSLTESVLRLFYSDPSWGWDDLLLALAKIEAASPAEWYRAAAKAVVANDYGMTWEGPSYFTRHLAFLASRTENIGYKVTSLSAQSTNDEYPTAKCVYDMIGNVETLLSQV